jgi:hypothetical protein
MNQGSRWVHLMKKTEVENLVLLSLLVTMYICTYYSPLSAVSHVLLLLGAVCTYVLLHLIPITHCRKEYPIYFNPVVP